MAYLAKMLDSAPQCEEHQKDLEPTREAFECTECDLIFQYPPIGEKNILSSTIFAAKKKASKKTSFDLPKFMGKKNNLHEAQDYRKENKSTINCPKKITVQENMANEETSQQIIELIEKEEFLPLEYKESSIEGAGNGIFALEEIEDGVGFLTYTGDIGPHYDLRVSDTRIEIGWIEYWKRGARESGHLLLEMDGRNGGRLVNTHLTKSEINCHIKKFFYQGNFAFVLITSRKIKAGEELFWDYGPTWNFDTKKEPVWKTKLSVETAEGEEEIQIQVDEMAEEEGWIRIEEEEECEEKLINEDLERWVEEEECEEKLVNWVEEEEFEEKWIREKDFEVSFEKIIPEEEEQEEKEEKEEKEEQEEQEQEQERNEIIELNFEDMIEQEYVRKEASPEIIEISSDEEPKEKKKKIRRKKRLELPYFIGRRREEKKRIYGVCLVCGDKLASHKWAKHEKECVDNEPIKKASLLKKRAK